MCCRFLGSVVEGRDIFSDLFCVVGSYFFQDPSALLFPEIMAPIQAFLKLFSGDD